MIDPITGRDDGCPLDPVIEARLRRSDRESKAALVLLAFLAVLAIWSWWW